MKNKWTRNCLQGLKVYTKIFLIVYLELSYIGDSAYKQNENSITF